MLISQIHLRVLAATLDIEGFSSKTVLQEAGLEGLETMDDGTWIPVKTYEKMVLAALRHSKVSYLGLVAGTSLASSKYGILPALVMNMPNLRQGLEDIITFAALVLPKSEISIEEAGGTATIQVTPILQRDQAGIFRAEFVVSAIIQMLRFGSAGSVELSLVNFTHAKPAHIEKYLEYIGAPVYFSKNETCITFNREVLDTPTPWHDKVAYLELKTKAELSLNARQKNSDAIQRVMRVFIESFPLTPTIDEVAQQLGLSARTLRRHLAYEGTSHKELLRSCRQLMAENGLADLNAPIKKVSHDLGFASVTSFHRAFKEWTGMTPQEWRGKRTL